VLFVVVVVDVIDVVVLFVAIGTLAAFLSSAPLLHK
jgi:hypothetical protein